MGDALGLLAALAAVLLVARGLGLIATRLGQPAVAGEILAGVLLGPTVLALVPPTPSIDLVGRISVSLFLLGAGMEVDLSTLRRELRTALAVGVGGILFPFALGFAVASLAPAALALETGDSTGGAIFFGIAMSISALPVIVRTLMNLGLYRTDFGMAVVAAAVLDDLVGWMLFALLLARLGTPVHAGWGPAGTVLSEAVLAVAMLTVVRRGADRALPSIAPRVGGVGVLFLAVALALAAGAWARWSGGQAMFGAFLAGIALGDSEHVPQRTRSMLSGCVENVFGPLFFGMIGLKVDFALHFDGRLCLLVISLACVAKLLGCSVGARLAGMPARRAWAFGFAMNSRGAMEIVLGVLALDAGIIGPRLLVALVVMALVTSLAAGPAIRRLLGPAAPAPRLAPRLPD
jgi:Kef-type K+ transport system membrane component KefB